MTLSRHILEQEERHPATRGELAILLAQIAFVAKVLARELRRAALVGKLGLIGDRNPTGDAQKKLDVFANEVFLQAFGENGLVAAVVSEELDEVKLISCGENAHYILCTDPLDGSSNTDINGALGTIFGIYRRASAGCCAAIEEVLRKGSDMAAAGYVLYSTSTLLVYSCGHGVNGFTLDHDLGEFLLSHENIRCPARGSSFSANLGRIREWHPGVQAFVEHLTTLDAGSGRPYSLRYSGALVGDLHRSLCEGGVYFYPPDNSHKTGKLRLVYECAPLAYVVEQAGGRASTGTRRILDLMPESVHQRVPLAIGSAGDVALYERFLNAEGRTNGMGIP
jgi:fructose-1,6-bisphosphatase I